MKNTVAMILAGGRGKRMDILCHGRSKPVLPYAGMWRVIDFSLSNCLHSGISNIAALIDYQRQCTAEYLQEWSTSNTGGSSLHILEPKLDSYKGTSDAVYQNLDYLRDSDPEAVLVLAGDHIYKMDFRKMLDFHQQKKADVTVGVIRVPIQQANRFGITTLDADSRITDFVEKPHHPTSNLASMGIYIFKPEVLIEHLIEDNAQPASLHDFGYALIPQMVMWNKVFAYEFNGYWRDIGTIDSYHEANM
jgi:glucose-1-phosphate adenylyltransferase